jgi:hypothetical protein
MIRSGSGSVSPNVLAQYDRYLQSLRYRQTYAELGDFTYFTLLFVTLGDERATTSAGRSAACPPSSRSTTGSPPTSAQSMISSDPSGRADRFLI